jgi:threonine/homoserine/homoserine lactone efflux protein
LIAFTLAAGLLTLTPGLDTAMVLRTATAEGPRRAAWAGLGILAGCLVWGAAVALGLGGLLAASEIAYNVLKWVGAGYLFWLGINLIWKPRAGFAVTEEESTGTGGWFMKGLLTNLPNPKVGVFYVTFLPQFVPTGVAVAPWTFGLAMIHALLGVVWFALLIGASVPLSRTLAKPAVVRTMDRLTGGVFLAFGAKLALSKR